MAFDRADLGDTSARAAASCPAGPGHARHRHLLRHVQVGAAPRPRARRRDPADLGRPQRRHPLHRPRRRRPHRAVLADLDRIIGVSAPPPRSASAAGCGRSRSTRPATSTASPRSRPALAGGPDRPRRRRRCRGVGIPACIRPARRPPPASAPPGPPGRSPQLTARPDDGPPGHAPSTRLVGLMSAPATTDDPATRRRPPRPRRRPAAPRRLRPPDPAPGASVARSVRAVAAGLLLAASLPPWGWWPLAFVGIALLDRLLAGAPAGSPLLPRLGGRPGPLRPDHGLDHPAHRPGLRGRRGLFFGSLLGLFCIARAAGRRAALGAHRRLGAVRVAARSRGRSAACRCRCWPSARWPARWRRIARVGGVLARRRRHRGASASASRPLAAASWRTGRRPRGRRRSWSLGWSPSPPRPATPATSSTSRSCRAAAHQGTRAIDTDRRKVFERHLEASEDVPGRGIDLVLWPENVVDTDGPTCRTPRRASELAGAGPPARRAARRSAPSRASTRPRFRNSQQVARRRRRAGRPLREGPAGAVRRVGAVPVADRAGRPRHAGRAATRPSSHQSGLLRTDAGAAGAVISWEVFFGDRARARSGRRRAALQPDQRLHLHWHVVQTQQVASSRLRAIETGRWVVQVAPTGFSAFVSPTARSCSAPAPASSASRPQRRAAAHRPDLVRPLRRRPGRCRARPGGRRLGADSPIAAAGRSDATPGEPTAGRRRRRRRREAAGVDLEEDGDRAVVDELDGHVGAEAAGGDRRRRARAARRHHGVDERLGLLGPRGGDPRRAPAPAGVAVERELADHQHLAADVGRRAVHHRRRRPSKTRRCQSLAASWPGLVARVVVGDADQHAQPRPDRSRRPRRRRVTDARRTRCTTARIGQILPMRGDSGTPAEPRSLGRTVAGTPLA